MQEKISTGNTGHTGIIATALSISFLFVPVLPVSPVEIFYFYFLRSYISATAALSSIG